MHRHTLCKQHSHLYMHSHSCIQSHSRTHAYAPTPSHCSQVWFERLQARWGRASVWSGVVGAAADGVRSGRLRATHDLLEMIDSVRSRPSAPVVLFDAWPRCRLARIQIQLGKVTVVRVHPRFLALQISSPTDINANACTRHTCTWSHEQPHLDQNFDPRLEVLSSSP